MVILVPASSSARERVKATLEGAAFTLAPLDAGLAQATDVLVDLTHPEGTQVLDRLRASPRGQLLPVLGLVDASVPTYATEVLAADALVSLSQLESELPWRLEQARLRHVAARDAADRQRDLALLLELTARYTESLDAQALLHDVMRRLAEAMDIERASMVLVDETRPVGYVMAASDDPTLRDLQIDLNRYPEIRETVRLGKPVLVEDAPSHPLLEGVQTQVAATGYRTIACLPLAVEGKVLGVLLVRASAKRKAFSLREVDFLATVAHATAVALRNARLLETVRGQTEREKSARLAAEALAQSLKRYESYFASISDGIAILDASANVLMLNPAAVKLLEVGVEQARGRHINALMQPSDEGVMLDVLVCVARGEVRQEVDLDVRTEHGRRLTLSLSGAPLHDDAGATAILSLRDVTLARRMALELRQTKEFLERLIDSSVDAIIAADMKGRIILFNKGAEVITGFSAEDALTQLNSRALYPARVAEEVMAKLRSPDFGGRGRLNVSREELITKTGEPVPVNMTASILYEGGREAATVGIFTDLRDRVQLERKLSNAEIRAADSERNAVIVALAGTAAHELNQPLTSVMGYAELLKRRLTEGEFAYRPVDIIYREAERMADIVRKIGKITRFETTDYPGDRTILDLDKASSHEE